MDRERLLAFVARIGLAEAARRFGVSPSTVKRWTRSGVSERAKPAVQQTLRRSEARVKAAATSRDLKKKTAQIGRVFPLPPRQRSGENLTPEQLTPRKDPSLTPAARDARERERESSSWETFETDRWEGKFRWFRIDRPYLDDDRNPLDLEPWKDFVLDEWRKSDPNNGREWFARVRVHAEKMFAYNPAYTGPLVHKRGRWQPFYTSSRSAPTPDSVRATVDHAFLYSTPTEKRGLNEASIHEQAQTRPVYIHSLMLELFAQKPRYKRPSLSEFSSQPSRRRRRR